MFRRFAIATAAAALLAVPGAAFAQSSLRVQPLTVDVHAPAQASALTLQNTSPNPITVQLRVFEWTQADGADRTVPTTDVVASPPSTTIPGGATYTIRVARTAGVVSSGEKAYRLWVDELPTASPERPAGRAVDIRIRYDLPVFFGEAAAAPNLSWRTFRSGGQLVVEATNRGSGHARVQGLKVGDVSFGEGLNGYVLAGSTRRWTSPAGATPPPANANVTLVAGVGGREVREAITVANR
jgi:fimbrial chaperone protein